MYERNYISQLYSLRHVYVFTQVHIISKMLL